MAALQAGAIDLPDAPSYPRNWKRNIPGGVPGLQIRRGARGVFGGFDSLLFRHTSLNLNDIIAVIWLHPPIRPLSIDQPLLGCPA